MRRKIIFFVMTIVLAVGTIMPVYGAKNGVTVKVTLPSFKVTLNGEEYNNSYSKYPLLVYKDITYFPMTYSDCRFLGLETKWDGTLTIENTGVTVAYNPYISSNKNSIRRTATIPSFRVVVNGKTIDNSKEKYPLLYCNGITYFPITWKFGVEEFGWDYNFDSKNGLVINSDNIQLRKISLTSDRAKSESGSGSGSGELGDNVTIANGYVYYEGMGGGIMKAPLADTSAAQKVYQLEIWSYGDGSTYNPHKLYNEDGYAMLYYHAGGATMGSDYLIRFNNDGTTTEFNNSQYIIKNFGDKTIKYWAGPMPGPGNLIIKTGSGEWKPLGSSDYIYGWNWSMTSNGDRGGNGVDTAYLVGDDLYILAYDMKAGEEAQKSGTELPTTGIHKVNIKTNEVTRISQRKVSEFQIEGNYIYYPSDDGCIYRFSIENGNEELLKQVVTLPNFIGKFAVLNGKVFWQDGLNENLYRLNGENVNFGAALDSTAFTGEEGMTFAGQNDEYLVCTFKETDISKYRIMVFDKTGKIVFKTSDKAYCRNISIEGNKIYFYNMTTRTVCVGNLIK